MLRLRRPRSTAGWTGGGVPDRTAPAARRPRSLSPGRHVPHVAALTSSVQAAPSPFSTPRCRCRASCHAPHHHFEMLSGAGSSHPRQLALVTKTPSGPPHPARPVQPVSVARLRSRRGGGLTIDEALAMRPPRRWRTHELSGVDQRARPRGLAPATIVPALHRPHAAVTRVCIRCAAFGPTLACAGAERLRVAWSAPGPRRRSTCAPTTNAASRDLLERVRAVPTRPTHPARACRFGDDGG